MGRTIDADALNSIKFRPSLYTHITPSDADAESYKRGWNDAIDSIIENAPTIEPERKNDAIQKFHDYQVEWLLSHCDLELESQLEELVVHFLHDTANCYMMEIGRTERRTDD